MPQQELHPAEDSFGDCLHLPIPQAGADQDRNRMSFWQPHSVAELALLREDLAASHLSKSPAHGEGESPELMVVCQAAWFVAMGQALEVVAVGYACSSPGHTPVAPLADHS